MGRSGTCPTYGAGPGPHEIVPLLSLVHVSYRLGCRSIMRVLSLLSATLLIGAGIAQQTAPDSTRGRLVTKIDPAQVSVYEDCVRQDISYCNTGRVRSENRGRSRARLGAAKLKVHDRCQVISNATRYGRIA